MRNVKKSMAWPFEQIICINSNCHSRCILLYWMDEEGRCPNTHFEFRGFSELRFFWGSVASPLGKVASFILWFCCCYCSLFSWDLIQWSGWREHAARFLMALWETVRPSRLHPIPVFPTVYIMSQTVIIRRLCFRCVWFERNAACQQMKAFFVAGSVCAECLCCHAKNAIMMFSFQRIKMSTGEVFAKATGEFVESLFEALDHVIMWSWVSCPTLSRLHVVFHSNIMH